MIEFAIITAPREQPTLMQSVKSFTENMKERVHIFAEPGNYELPQNQIIHHNSKKLGAFKNYHNALSWLVNHSNKRFVCVLLDDMIYSPKAMAILNHGLLRGQRPYAAYSLITIKQDVTISNEEVVSGWIEVDPGWWGWGGNFVLPIDVARKIIKTKFYQNHLHNYTKNEQIDGCMYESFRELGLKSFVHNPSLSQHIGETSTLNHGELTENRKGLNFEL